MKESGRLWVRYDNGHEAPLEPRQGAGHIEVLGYRRCPDADHIRRDMAQAEAQLAVQEEQRCETRAAAAAVLCRVSGVA